MTDAEMKRILVIDDEENLRLVLRKILSDEGYKVLEAADGAKGLEQLDKDVIDYILCDVRMPRMDGLTFLKNLKERRIDIPVIMLSAYGTVESAVEAIKAGAFDYVFKPFQPDEILLTIKKAEEQVQLKNENIALRKAASGKIDVGIIARSKAMTELLAMVERVAQVKSPVLITGESGTGKELIARAIHRKSSRCDKPFIAVNCGAIPDKLLESEFFGHERGAFTDAVKDRPGLFREADQGTLFLDEVAELPLDMQVKLLRVLQFEEVRPVGGSASVNVDVRIIAATAKDPSKEIIESRFREDLYYRLNVLPLHIAPLRKRMEDVPPLLDHFITVSSARMGRNKPAISPGAIEKLMAYEWPGNVRELENLTDRMLVLSAGNTVEPSDLPGYINKDQFPKARTELDSLDLKAGVRRLEAQYITEALNRAEGNRSEAARLLGISYPSLLTKVKLYGLGK